MFGSARRGFSFFSFAVSAAGAAPVKSRTGADTSEYTAEDTSTGPIGSAGVDTGAAPTVIAAIASPRMATVNPAVSALQGFMNGPFFKRRSTPKKAYLITGLTQSACSWAVWRAH